MHWAHRTSKEDKNVESNQVNQVPTSGVRGSTRSPNPGDAGGEDPGGVAN